MAPIYIGETSDLSQRLDYHRAMPCIQRNGAAHIVVYTKSMNDQRRRKAVESDLLAKYDPSCNWH